MVPIIRPKLVHLAALQYNSCTEEAGGGVGWSRFRCQASQPLLWCLMSYRGKAEGYTT